MESIATPAEAGHPEARLTGRVLVVLQLLAVGYSPAQIDALLEADGATQHALRSARAALGGVGLALVLDEARRRALIT